MSKIKLSYEKCPKCKVNLVRLHSISNLEKRFECNACGRIYSEKLKIVNKSNYGEFATIKKGEKWK